MNTLANIFCYAHSIFNKTLTLTQKHLYMYSFFFYTTMYNCYFYFDPDEYSF